MVRQRSTQSSGTQFSKQDAINIALMAQDVANIKGQVQTINDTLKKDFVNKEEFTPVRNLVYGFVVLIIVAVVGAMIALVVVRPGQTVQIAPTSVSIPAK